MSRPVVEPALLVGERVVAVTIGWHVHDGREKAVRYFLHVGEGEIEIHPAGDGSIEFFEAAVPDNFDMGQRGRFEFRAVGSDAAIARLVGKVLTGVERLRWRGAVVGLRLLAGAAVVVLANEGDEVFVSTGALPPDYADATIE